MKLATVRTSDGTAAVRVDNSTGNSDEGEVGVGGRRHTAHRSTATVRPALNRRPTTLDARASVTDPREMIRP